MQAPHALKANTGVAAGSGHHSRKAFIKECRRFVAERRLQNFQKYKAHVEKVLKKRAGLAVE